MKRLSAFFTSAALLFAAFFHIPPAQAGRSAVKKGLVYDTESGRKLQLDLYYPSSPAPRRGYPLIISIHGGGWRIGDRHKDLFLRNLTKDGYAIASIDYRLSGTAKFPAQIDDARKSLAWLVTNARLLRLDETRIGVTGVSAGGHLALLLGLTEASLPHRIKAICAFYPPTDLISIIPPEKRDRQDNLVALLLGAPVSERLELARRGSPVTYVGKDATPILLVHGNKDRLVPIAQSETLNSALRKAGVRSSLIIYAGRGHGFRPRSDTLPVISKFFDRNLRN